jgi:protein-S-isoprenylcysteine O-methyltransferase Ste14
MGKSTETCRKGQQISRLAKPIRHSIIRNTKGKDQTTELKRYWTTPEGQGPSKIILIGLLSLLSRVLPATYFAIVCLGFWKNFIQTGKWTSLLWIFSEGLVILLLVFRRESSRLSMHPWDWIVALGGSFTVLFIRPAATAIVPEFIAIALQFSGTAFEIYAKVFLGRSFGIVAADRGIVLGGPYHIVRHPIYLGYFVTHVGFLLANWSLRNIALFIVIYFFQISRILSEERLLKSEEPYSAYCERVRYRLIPFIF